MAPDGGGTSGRLTVTLTDQEVRHLMRLGDLARTHNLSLHGQTALARIMARIAERLERAETGRAS